MTKFCPVVSQPFSADAGFVLGVCSAAEWPEYSIPVVFLLTEKYRVAQLLRNKRGLERDGVQTPRLTRPPGAEPWISSTACGSAFGLEEI